MVILISICSNAAPIHCPAYGSKIVLQLIDILTPTFAQRIIRRWVSGTMSGSYNRCSGSDPSATTAMPPRPLGRECAAQRSTKPQLAAASPYQPPGAQRTAKSKSEGRGGEGRWRTNQGQRRGGCSRAIVRQPPTRELPERRVKGRKNRDRLHSEHSGITNPAQPGTGFCSHRTRSETAVPGGLIDQDINPLPQHLYTAALPGQ